jgi:pimeloyl-ACP methyl ester carboxylesterase
VEGDVATYVLVHGTGSGGWLWDPVVTLLRELGHSVHALTLVGVGDRASEGSPNTNVTTHVHQIISLIQELAAPQVVLVGFSYGGLVVEGVAAAIPDRIAQLVLIDAMLLPKGKAGFDLVPASAAEQLRAAARNQGEGWKLPPMPLELVGGIGWVESGISAADIERTLEERRGTQPIGTFEEPIPWDESSLASVSRRYIICTDKPSSMRERTLARVGELRDGGSTVDELPTGHFPMRSMPTALTALLIGIAAPSDSD